jgi:hypothetical protein
MSLTKDDKKFVVGAIGDAVSSSEDRIKEHFDKRLEETFLKYRDSVMRGIDKMVAELEKTRESYTIVAGKYDEILERIEKIEKHIFPN